MRLTLSRSCRFSLTPVMVCDGSVVVYKDASTVSVYVDVALVRNLASIPSLAVSESVFGVRD